MRAHDNLDRGRAPGTQWRNRTRRTPSRWRCCAERTRRGTKPNGTLPQTRPPPYGTGECDPVHAIVRIADEAVHKPTKPDLGEQHDHRAHEDQADDGPIDSERLLGDGHGRRLTSGVPPISVRCCPATVSTTIYIARHGVQVRCAVDGDGDQRGGRAPIQKRRGTTRSSLRPCPPVEGRRWRRRRIVRRDPRELVDEASVQVQDLVPVPERQADRYDARTSVSQQGGAFPWSVRRCPPVS